MTFGWAPRFLHSTGQFHKGGPQVGAFLQVTGAVTTDLDVPGREFTFGRLRALLAARIAHPVTFGWAPRFLHSTGQFHKGGPQTGAFLQVTGAVTEDLDVPGREFTFAGLQAAQALGDLRALDSRDRPVLTLHLTDRRQGLRGLLAAAEGRR